MTYLTGTRVTARGQMGTVYDFYKSLVVSLEIETSSAVYEPVEIDYWILWDDGSRTLESPDAIDEVDASKRDEE